MNAFKSSCPKVGEYLDSIDHSKWTLYAQNNSHEMLYGYKSNNISEQSNSDKGVLRNVRDKSPLRMIVMFCSNANEIFLKIQKEAGIGFGDGQIESDVNNSVAFEPTPYFRGLQTGARAHSNSEGSASWRLHEIRRVDGTCDVHYYCHAIKSNVKCNVRLSGLKDDFKWPYGSCPKALQFPTYCGHGHFYIRQLKEEGQNVSDLVKKSLPDIACNKRFCKEVKEIFESDALICPGIEEVPLQEEGKVCVAPAIDLSRKKKKKRLNFNQKRIENKGKTNLNVMEKMFKYGGPSAEV